MLITVKMFEREIHALLAEHVKKQFPDKFVASVTTLVKPDADGNNTLTAEVTVGDRDHEGYVG